MVFLAELNANLKLWVMTLLAWIWFRNTGNKYHQGAEIKSAWIFSSVLIFLSTGTNFFLQTIKVNPLEEGEHGWVSWLLEAQHIYYGVIVTEDGYYPPWPRNALELQDMDGA